MVVPFDPTPPPLAKARRRQKPDGTVVVGLLKATGPP